MVFIPLKKMRAFRLKLSTSVPTAAPWTTISVSVANIILEVGEDQRTAFDFDQFHQFAQPTPNLIQMGRVMSCQYSSD